MQPRVVEILSANAVQSVSIDKIRKTGTQSREKLDAKTVSDLREDIRDSNPIAPIVVFFDGTDNWIADGYHRVEAHRKEKRDIISAEIRSGTKDAALRFNIESNASADKTRWTSADKRNAVTMLLQSLGAVEITRARAQEIGALCRASHWLVESIADELMRQNLPKPTPPAQPPVAQAVTTNPVPEDKADHQEDKPPKEALATRAKPVNGRRSLEMAERDIQIATLASYGHSQAEIARRLNVSTGTVSDSFRRQKLTPETANPLVKVLEQAQLHAALWAGHTSSIVEGLGAAALWPSATESQKKEVIEELGKATKNMNAFANQLKRAKGKQ